MSKQTEQSERSKALIELGKRLVTELNLDHSVDTLGRWMAHHIAELIIESEEADTSDKSTKNNQLREAILSLWRHRFELPTNRRPFNDFEPILRALESLDPENKVSRYFTLPGRPEDEVSKESKQWIELSKGLDDTAKILINHCLVSAADSAIDQSMEWVEVARKTGLDESYEFRVIEFIGKEKSLGENNEENISHHRILSERLEKLETFVSLASAMADDINFQLKKIASSSDTAL